MQNNVMNFSSDCERKIGKSNVHFDTETLSFYLKSMSGEKRDILGVVFPSNTYEVQQVVRVANEHKVLIYPISTGKNWGLGSALPVKNGCVLIDLSKMNKIRHVDTKFGYAVIEPGVTQQQLYEYLFERNLPFIFDITGSAADTSIIGNILDGGVGYFGLRFEGTSGFEIVLGSGEILKTGFGHFSNSITTYLYKYGIGPQLDGLFIQSNYGIVTSLAIDLIPKKQRQIALTCSIKREDLLFEFIEALARLRRSGILQNVIKIGNLPRSLNTICPLMYNALSFSSIKPPDKKLRESVERFFKQNYGVWSAVTGLMGTSSQIHEFKRQILKTLKGIARVRFITDRWLYSVKKLTSLLKFIPYFRYQNALIESIEPLYNITKGIPTNKTIPSLYWPLGLVPSSYTSPDQSNVGMICYLPIVPLDGNIALNVIRKIELISKKYKFTPSITLSIISNKAMWGVIDLSYDRTKENLVISANNCISEIYSTLMRDGIVPQRLGIDSMQWIINENDNYWKLVKKIKSILDPNGIIAPHRYNLI